MNWSRITAAVYGALAAPLMLPPAMAQGQPGQLAVVCTAYTDVNRRAPTIYATASELQAAPPEPRLRQLVEQSGAKLIGLNCWSAATEAEALVLQSREGNRMFAMLPVPVGWYDGKAPPKAAVVPSLPKTSPSAATSGSGYITIEERPRPAPESAARTALESQRRTADAGAKSAADQARANAEYQARLTKFFAELRRRGRAQ